LILKNRMYLIRVIIYFCINISIQQRISILSQIKLKIKANIVKT
ncbi:hypothetical protein HMPREF1983_00767, partial [Gemella bergeri ATCC 700627]